MDKELLNKIRVISTSKDIVKLIKDKVEYGKDIVG